MKCSVIMAMYNAEAYIQPCLKSICNQTFSDFELIIIDDGSTDNSAKLVKEFADEDSRIRYYFQENQSQCVALNHGITKAQGEYITFIDNDDCLELDTFEQVVRSLNTVATDVVVYGYYQEFVDEGYSTVCKPANMIATTFEQCQQALINIFQNGVFHVSWNKWYRREVVLDHKIQFDARYNSMGDYTFNCQLFEHVNSIATLDFIGYHYLKRNRDSLVTSYVKDMVPCFEERRKITTHLFDTYQLWTNGEAMKYYNVQYYYESEDFLINLYKPKCDLTAKTKHQYIQTYVLDEKSKVIYNSMQADTIYAKIFKFVIQTNSPSFIGFTYTLLTGLKNTFFGLYKSFRKQQYKKYK